MYLSCEIQDKLHHMAYHQTFNPINVYYDLKYMHSELFCDIPKHKIGKAYVSEKAYKKLQDILKKSLEDPTNVILYFNFTDFYENVILGKVTDEYFNISESLTTYLEYKTEENLNNLLKHLKKVYYQ